MNQEEINKKCVDMIGKIAEADLEHILGHIDDKTFIETVKRALRKC